MTGTIAEKASPSYTDTTTIPVSIPESLTSLSEVPRLQKNKQECWNGQLEKEEQLNCQWRAVTGECAHLTCGWTAQHMTLGSQSHPPAVSECTWLWFLTLQLECVTGDGAVTVLHVQDALATVTETPGLDQSHAAFCAKESIYC